MDLDEDEYQSTRKFYTGDKPEGKTDRCYCANSKTIKCINCIRNIDNYKHDINKNYEFMYFDDENCKEEML